MTKGELVERLKPLHVVDQPLIAVADVLIAEKRPGVAAVVDAWILENNALKPEAATALSERDARIAELEGALRRIEKWHGEFPETGRYWDEPNNKEPMSYAAAFGSNGERDFMRQIASDALTRRDRTTEKKDG